MINDYLTKLERKQNRTKQNKTAEKKKQNEKKKLPDRYYFSDIVFIFLSNNATGIESLISDF